MQWAREAELLQGTHDERRMAGGQYFDLAALTYPTAPRNHLAMLNAMDLLMPADSRGPRNT